MQTPALWIVPPSKRKGIVINVPEMRLHHFHMKKGSVSTYPVTVGEEGTPTPLGTFRIVNREVDPEWNILPKLQHKYNKKIMQSPLWHLDLRYCETTNRGFPYWRTIKPLVLCDPRRRPSGW
jgi:lipoprotein-anchoring transpeptidase ErfK/SrfK